MADTPDSKRGTCNGSHRGHVTAVAGAKHREAVRVPGQEKCEAICSGCPLIVKNEIFVKETRESLRFPGFLMEVIGGNSEYWKVTRLSSGAENTQKVQKVLPILALSFSGLFALPASTSRKP